MDSGRSTPSPASDGELIKVDRRAAVAAHAVDLEVGEKDLGPAECEGGRDCFVDLLEDTVESDVLVGDVAGAVAGVVDDEVVPGIGSPLLWIARSGGVDPLIDGVVGCAGVDGVVPGAAVAIALDSEYDGLAAGHDLVHVEFEVGDVGGGGSDVDLHVVGEVGGSCICAKDRPVALAGGVLEGDAELTGCTADGWPTNEGHGSGRDSPCRAILNHRPGVGGLDVFHGCGHGAGVLCRDGGAG